MVYLLEYTQTLSIFQVTTLTLINYFLQYQVYFSFQDIPS